MAKRKYRLLVGKYYAPDFSKPPLKALVKKGKDVVAIEDDEEIAKMLANGSLKREQVFYPDREYRAVGSENFRPGMDIIETEFDLLRFNQPGAQKFELLAEGAVLSPTEHIWDSTKETIEQFAERVGKAKPEPVVDEPATDSSGTLESMTVEELRKLADEEEIDLRGATKKQDILRILRQATAQPV